jgi:membrane protein implicated in regulation of membrane protease activity
MFEFFGTIAEALSGYIAGRYGASKRSSFHLSAVVLALGCGLIFFSAYGLYELIFPAQNPMGNVWLGLLLFSLGVALLVYLFLLIAHWIESRKKRNDGQK